MRLVEQLVTTGPVPAAQHVIDAQGQCIFLADVATRFVDDGQPVGIWVLAEANVGAGLATSREHAGQVFCGRLGRVFVLPVRMSRPEWSVWQPSSSSSRRPSTLPRHDSNRAARETCGAESARCRRSLGPGSNARRPCRAGDRDDPSRRAAPRRSCRAITGNTRCPSAAGITRPAAEKSFNPLYSAGCGWPKSARRHRPTGSAPGRRPSAWRQRRRRSCRGRPPLRPLATACDNIRPVARPSREIKTGRPGGNDSANARHNAWPVQA